MTSLKDVFSKVCSLLNKHEVDFIVIGGLAVATHGFARNTFDIDFWYKPTHENYLNIISCFRELGVDVSSLDESVFNPTKAFLRFPVNGINIEFLPSILGNISYADAKRSATKIDFGDMPISILSRNHLIENKLATNRPIDKIDVEELKRRNESDEKL